MLIKYSLRVVSTSNHRNAHSQRLLGLIKLSITLRLVDLVHKVDVKIVNFRVLKHQCVIVDVKCCLFHTFNVLYINGNCELCG